MSEHNITMISRKHTEIGGALSVLSFDDEQVVLKTSMGICCVQGKGLNISKLDLDGGDVFIEGEVLSLYYPVEAEEKQGFFARIFK